MLATNEAYSILENAKIPGIDAIYTVNIPPEEINNVNRTIVLITDANTQPDLYGDDKFGALDRQIEIQIFYKLHPVVDPEWLDVQIYRALEQHDFYVGQNHGHSFDPDTGQITSTFYCNNQEILKN